MIPTCATCKHWHGDPSAYMAECSNEDVAAARTTFDAVCMFYEARNVAGFARMETDIDMSALRKQIDDMMKVMIPLTGSTP
jgi:hypothetical protein